MAFSTISAIVQPAFLARATMSAFTPFLSRVANGSTLPVARSDRPSTLGAAGVADLRDRMMTGRFKVFDHCSEWFEEFRQYHRKDGRIVKAHDDLLDATRYGVMMLRMAREVRDGKIKRRRPRTARDVEYDVFGL